MRNILEAMNTQFNRKTLRFSKQPVIYWFLWFINYLTSNVKSAVNTVTLTLLQGNLHFLSGITSACFPQNPQTSGSQSTEIYIRSNQSYWAALLNFLTDFSKKYILYNEVPVASCQNKSKTNITHIDCIDTPNGFLKKTGSSGAKLMHCTLGEVAMVLFSPIYERPFFL